MANRSWQAEALILGLSNFGEGHKNARLFIRHTKEESLIDATFFGGAKSRMRGLILPYHSGLVWLYSNPVTGRHKITDFAVSDYRSGIRDCLTRSWCAAVASEVVRRLHGTPDWLVVNAFLHGIAEVSPSEAKIALLRFLWRILLGAGVAPDLYNCMRCGISLSADTRRAYLPREDGCVCADCRLQYEPHFIIHGASAQFLFAVAALPAAQSRAIMLSETQYHELKQLLFFLTTALIGRNLKSLDSAGGIL